MENPEMETESLDTFLGRVHQEGIGGEVSGLEPAVDIAAGADRRPRSELLQGVHLKVRVELGRARLAVKEAIDLAPGSVVELDQLADEPVDLYVNDVLLARGEILVVNDCFCIRVTDVLAHGGEAES